MSNTFNSEKCLYLSTRFYKHPFLRSLRKEFGSKGFVLSVVILEMVGEKAMEVKFGRKFREAVVKEFPEISMHLVTMVVRRMTEEGFLDKRAFQERHVLTPPASYIVSCVDDIYSGEVDREAPYYFILPKEKTFSSGKRSINTEGKTINSEETSINSELIHINTEEINNNTELCGRNTYKHSISSECSVNIQNNRQNIQYYG